MNAFDFLGQANGGFSGIEALSASAFGSRLRFRIVQSAVSRGTYRPDSRRIAEAMLSGPRADFFRLQMGEISLDS